MHEFLAATIKFASPGGAVEVSAREENEKIMVQCTAPSRTAVNSDGYTAAMPPSAIQMGVSSDKSCRSFGYPMLKIASCEQIAALLIPAGAGSLLVGQRHGVPDVPTRGCCRSKPSATRWFTQKSRVAELPEELLSGSLALSLAGHFAATRKCDQNGFCFSLTSSVLCWTLKRRGYGLGRPRLPVFL